MSPWVIVVSIVIFRKLLPSSIIVLVYFYISRFILKGKIMSQSIFLPCKIILLWTGHLNTYIIKHYI